MSAVIEWRKWKKGRTAQYHLQPAELHFGRRRLIKAVHVHPCYLFVICLSHEVELFGLFFLFLPIVLISGTARESEEAGLNLATNSDTSLTEQQQSNQAAFKAAGDPAKW